jgi:hypothetical protein
MEVANKYFKNVGEFKCLGPTKYRRVQMSGTYGNKPNCIHKDIKSRINSGNVSAVLFRIICLPG